MAAIAAIQGAKRGKAIGAQVARAKLAQAASEAERWHKEREEFASKIIETYDANASGTLAKEELKNMLTDYSARVYKDRQAPSDHDLAFLIALCDRALPGSKEGDHVVDRKEVLDVCAAWGDYMEHKEVIADLIKKSDADLDGEIDQSELAHLLLEVEGAKDLKEIPDEVVAWIFKTSDVSLTGKLCGAEIARALCAFEAWRGERAGQAPGQGAARHLVVADDLPPPNRSCTCTLQ